MLISGSRLSIIATTKNTTVGKSIFARSLKEDGPIETQGDHTGHLRIPPSTTNRHQVVPFLASLPSPHHDALIRIVTAPGHSGVIRVDNELSVDQI